MPWCSFCSTGGVGEKHQVIVLLQAASQWTRFAQPRQIHNNLHFTCTPVTGASRLLEALLAMITESSKLKQ